MPQNDLIAELKRCEIDLFEAADKFCVLSYHIKDEEARKCAHDRMIRFEESGRRIRAVLKEYGV